tara:strand:- start:5542 stop:6384 length:843 start_codon:yes stop_codon:yes gene_type:complete
MRDNQKRMSAAADPAPQAAEPNAPALNFTTPTEFVDLPSKGRFYPEEHPLHGQDTIEIKYMTARDEDILTSPTLLKKGLAIDRFLQNVIVNGAINIDTLLSGDKNAILIASRINGFGADYTTKLSCPGCQSTTENSFDLSAVGVYDGNDFGEYSVQVTASGTYTITLPKTKAEVEVRLLTSKDENELAMVMQRKKKKKALETNLTDQLRKIIVSVSGVNDPRMLHQFVMTLPAFDSRYLRSAYLKAVPGMNMTQDFTCDECGFEQEVDIPMTVDFFWSKQ